MTDPMTLGPAARRKALEALAGASRTSTISAVGGALPPHRYDQEQLITAARALWGESSEKAGARAEKLFRNTLVGSRCLAMPLERYGRIRGFGERSAVFAEVATDLGERAIREALDQAGLAPEDVDAIFFTTVTGVAAPSIDARLVNRLGLRLDVKRTPMFGLGCLAGAAGIARVHDYLVAYPDHTAVLLAVELCSLTLQPEDLSVANLIASGLFGDGAAAVVMRGAACPPAHAAEVEPGARPLPRVLASRSSFYPDTERVMGWDVGDEGFRIVLSAGVPDVVRDKVAPDVDAFLAAHGLGRKDIARWVAHPGGPKVLEAFAEALTLPEGALAASWRSLAELGNLSSASVLHVLRDIMAAEPPAPGSYGLMLAMGPGFCAELVLLQW